MKETTIAPSTTATFPINAGLLPYGLLVLASVLALVGGFATSVLFFGLLLLFGALLAGSRQLSSPRRLAQQGD